VPQVRNPSSSPHDDQLRVPPVVAPGELHADDPAVQAEPLVGAHLFGGDRDVVVGRPPDEHCARLLHLGVLLERSPLDLLAPADQLPGGAPVVSQAGGHEGLDHLLR
jgi:hypothetical protein